ncbi:MAG: hypothetical protein ACI84D_000434, partial [Thalassolituus oleivorans]
TLLIDLPEAGRIEVRVTDVLGREVLVLLQSGMSAGTAQPVVLDASELPSGVYVYRVLLMGATESHSGVGLMTLHK